MERFRFHDLRHGYASRLAERGHSDQELAALLGHADSQMVSRYSHLRPETLGATADSLEAHAKAVRDADVVELERILERRRSGAEGEDA